MQPPGILDSGRSETQAQLEETYRYDLLCQGKKVVFLDHTSTVAVVSRYEQTVRMDPDGIHIVEILEV